MNKPIPLSMSMCAGTEDWHKCRDEYLRKLNVYVEALEAQHAESRAENERLKKAIADHNQDLEASCAVMHTERSDMCHHYESRGRNCCDCPKDYAIELSGEGE